MDIWATLCFFHERWLQRSVLLSGGHTAGIASPDLEPRAWCSGTMLAASHPLCCFHAVVWCFTFSVYFRKQSVPVSDKNHFLTTEEAQLCQCSSPTLQPHHLAIGECYLLNWKVMQPWHPVMMAVGRSLQPLLPPMSLC